MTDLEFWENEFRDELKMRRQTVSYSNQSLYRGVTRRQFEEAWLGLIAQFAKDYDQMQKDLHTRWRSVFEG